MSASVKIMLSYDYCHFEICKATDQPTTDRDIDNMRKDVQRLADKAVQQYKIAKVVAEKMAIDKHRRIRLEAEVQSILKNVPEDSRTPEHKAKIKALQDREFVESQTYDYEDDFDEAGLEEG